VYSYAIFIYTNKGDNLTTLKMIEELEGFERRPYPDPLSGGEPYTFGYGFTYITKEEAEEVLKIRIRDITNGLWSKYRWFRNLSDVRQTVIVNMVYQIGFAGFDKFKKTIEYIKNKEYEEAGIEMLDSSWARQMHELDIKDGVDIENRAEYLSRLFIEDQYDKRRM
jgi:lysozyme